MQAIGASRQSGGRAAFNFADLDEQLQAWIKKLSSLSEFGGPSIEELGRRVEQKIAPVVRKFLLFNYDRSAMANQSPGSKYKRTGKLRDSIGKVVVDVTPGYRWGKRWTGLQFKISMPAGVAPYESPQNPKRVQSKKRPFYTVAASLNWGSVRAPREDREVLDLPTGQRYWKNRPIVGESAKRSIKKMILGGGMSYRSRKRIQEGTQSRQWGGKIIGGHVLENEIINPKGGSLTISGHHTVVTAPKNFFFLSPAQKKILQGIAHEVVVESSREMMQAWGR